MTDSSTSLIRSRLLEHARDLDALYDHVLKQYAMERVLHRMASSAGNEGTVLRGGWAMAVRLGVPHRRLDSLDLLCPAADREEILAEIRGIGGTAADGLMVDDGSIRTLDLRDGVGVRLRMFCYLESAQIPLRLDFGFGHALVPTPEVLQLPSMLDLPGAPMMDVCSIETVVAEAVVSIVRRGPRAVRMSDFYDTWLCLQVDPMTDLDLALQAAFATRETPIPGEIPYVLTEQFAESEHACKHWSAFTRGSAPTTEIELGEAVGAIRGAVMRLFEATGG